MCFLNIRSTSAPLCGRRARAANALPYRDHHRSSGRPPRVIAGKVLRRGLQRRRTARGANAATLAQYSNPGRAAIASGAMIACRGQPLVPLVIFGRGRARTRASPAKDAARSHLGHIPEQPATSVSEAGRRIGRVFPYELFDRKRTPHWATAELGTSSDEPRRCNRRHHRAPAVAREGPNDAPCGGANRGP